MIPTLECTLPLGNTAFDPGCPTAVELVYFASTPSDWLLLVVLLALVIVAVVAWRGQMSKTPAG